MLRQFCEKIHFPAEAIDFLESVEGKIDKNATAKAAAQYFAKDEAHLETLRAEAERTGLSEYTVTLFMLLDVFWGYLRLRYAESGFSEEMFYSAAEDLTFKLKECHKNNGIWGNCALHWYREIFELRCIRLGRLQYVKTTWQEPVDVAPVKQGDTVFKIHIPSSGPLTPESVEESFAMAKKFFRERGELTTDYFPVMCASWLVYPPHHDVFPAGSNLQKFQEMFTVTSAYERDRDFPRVFDRPYTEDFDSLPENTSLQRNFKKFLQNGGKMGLGRGILFR